MKHRSVTSNTACSRLLAVSSGENSRKCRLRRPAWRRTGRASARPTRRCCRPCDRPGASTGTSYVARSSGGRSSRSRPPFAYGVADIRLSPSGASAAQLRHQPAGLVEQRLRASTTAATPPASAGARGCRPVPTSGTWWARNVPCTWMPSTTSGPVQPLGVRSTIAGQPAAVGPSREPRPDVQPVVRAASGRRTAPGTPRAGRPPTRRPGPSPGCAGTPPRPRPRYGPAPWARRSCSR